MENCSSPRIWDDRVLKPNSYVRVLRRFVIGNPPADAQLAITADSNYAVWINGSFVGCGQYADFPFDKVYDEYAVSAFLRAGENTLAVLVYCSGEACSVYLPGDPGVSFRITSGEHLLAESDGECLTSPATDYVSGDAVQRISSQLSFSFRYNACEYDGWHDDGYPLSGDWERAEPLPGWEHLRPRPIERLRIEEPLPATLLSGGEFREEIALSEDPGERISRAALTLTELRALTGQSVDDARRPLDGKTPITFTVPGGDGVYLILDLGQETSGFFTLDIDAPRSTLVDIGYGEHLTDGRVRSRIGHRSFSATYLCRGGREQYMNHFRRFGCRYLQLHVRAHSFTLYYAGIRPTVYPAEVRGSFLPADRLHRRIYETCVHTLLTCMHEHYEDCPWREQALYTMDSRNQMLFGYYALGEYRFARASLRLLANSQRADGLLELCAPAKLSASSLIPCYSLAFVVQCMEYCLYSGDLTLATEMLPVCRRILTFFGTRKDDDGLPLWVPGMWNFYEWADGLDGELQRKAEMSDLTADAPLSAFYAMALSAMCDLCRWAGESPRAYESEHRALLAAMDRVFYDAEHELYASYIRGGKRVHFAELTQSLFLYCGVVTDRRRARHLREVLADETNTLVRVTLSHSVFKYEALLADPDFACGVFEEIADKWGEQLFRGATTFWETEDGEQAFGLAGSLCHAWSAAPAYLYFAYVLGIRPTKPGFATYTKNPLPTNILAASATLPLPEGSIKFWMDTANGKPKLTRIE